MCDPTARNLETSLNHAIQYLRYNFFPHLMVTYQFYCTKLGFRFFDRNTHHTFLDGKLYGKCRLTWENNTCVNWIQVTQDKI